MDSTYKVKEEDLIGTLEGFPLEVAQWLIDEQVRQGNQADISVFQKNRFYKFSYGGIDWKNCEIFEDQECSEIIFYKNFDVFFKKFPKHSTKTESLRIPKPEHYQSGIDTFARMEANCTTEECLAFAKGNIDSYNWRTKGQDLQDFEKIIANAEWAIKCLKSKNQ